MSVIVSRFFAMNVSPCFKGCLLGSLVSSGIVAIHFPVVTSLTARIAASS